jgi:Na+/H+ antiporter NhaC
MNYYFIIIAFLIVFIVWMYFATKNAPEEEDKVINLTFNINTEPEEVPTKKVKRPVGRPRKTIK